MCQRPKQTFRISTVTQNNQKNLCVQVYQCPKRAFLISTINHKEVQLMMCVNALNGLFSFLPDRKSRCYCNSRCQCPKRAFLISTVPSGNPCKYWLPRLIFAGICQIILKTAVFLQFFGLFIICSYFTVPLAPFHVPIIRQTPRNENPFSYIQKCNVTVQPWFFLFPLHLFFYYTVISI